MTTHNVLVPLNFMITDDKSIVFVIQNYANVKDVHITLFHAYSPLPEIDVRNNPGKGCTIVLRLPLTMAIIEGMIVKVGSERYILPMTAIKQVMRPEESAYTNIAGKGEVMNAMGQLLPLVRLYELFSLEPEQRDPWDGIVVVVVSGWLCHIQHEGRGSNDGSHRRKQASEDGEGWCHGNGFPHS